MEHLSLLAGGREHARDEWEKAAADVLRKNGRMTGDDPDALVWDKLTRTTLDGIAIPPLGTPESVADLPDTGLPGAAPFTRGACVSRADEGWDVRAHLADPDVDTAAESALTDLENGATSLWLTLGRGGLPVADLERLLEKVYVDLAPVALDCPEDPAGAAEAFLRIVADRDVPPAPGTSLGGDPIGARIRGVETSGEAHDVVARLAELARKNGIFALTVDATAVHDAGATDAQELGYSIAAGAAYLRILAAAGSDVTEAAKLIEFRYAATDEQLTTTAKFRAARRLWQRVLELSGLTDAPGQVQHAVSSRPMTTKYDPWVNMLRGTVAAFAAGVGGAASVTVLPFDSAIGVPDTLGRRIARNTSSLLIHESHVAKVTDPAGGSYAIEKLTEDLAKAGWAEFQRIEADGGIETGSAGLLDRIRTEGVEPRSRQVATRKRAITGVSEFPNLEEALPQRRPLPEGASRTHRYGAEFEAMRDEPATTPVFLATMGPIAQHTARATFAANLLAAGGVDTVAAGPTTGVEDVVAAYAGQPVACPVVCLAGTDAAYAEWGTELATALRETGAAYVVLAGKPGEKTVAESDIDDHAAMGVDALAFLTRVRKELK